MEVAPAARSATSREALAVTAASAEPAAVAECRTAPRCPRRRSRTAGRCPRTAAAMARRPAPARRRRPPTRRPAASWREPRRGGLPRAQLAPAPPQAPPAWPSRRRARREALNARRAERFCRRRPRRCPRSPARRRCQRASRGRDPHATMRPAGGGRVAERSAGCRQHEAAGVRRAAARGRRAHARRHTGRRTSLTARSSQQFSRSMRMRPREPPHGRVIEQQRLDQRLQQVDEIVVAADVRELVRENRLELLRRQAGERARPAAAPPDAASQSPSAPRRAPIAAARIGRVDVQLPREPRQHGLPLGWRAATCRASSCGARAAIPSSRRRLSAATPPSQTITVTASHAAPVRMRPSVVGDVAGERARGVAGLVRGRRQSARRSCGTPGDAGARPARLAALEPAPRRRRYRACATASVRHVCTAVITGIVNISDKPIAATT